MYIIFSLTNAKLNIILEIVTLYFLGLVLVNAFFYISSFNTSQYFYYFPENHSGPALNQSGIT